MGRSLRKVTTATLWEKLPPKPYFHAPSQTYYNIVEHGNDVFERQWQIGYDGQETNVEEKRMDYVLGSGNHGQTFLHVTAQDTLEQLPFGWYAENGGTWAMIPGYDRPDNAGSTRLVKYECLFCHDSYPHDPPGPSPAPTAPVYHLPLPQGIGCQRCHGPGERHVETVTRAGATLAQVRASIVNPAQLTPEREFEVCLQCHLETSSLLLPHALLRVDRGMYSYRPGQPLGAYRLDLDRAPEKNTRFEIADAPYRLRQSQCYLQTQSWAPAKRMQCTTCHDPHNIPRGEAATQHYDAVCLTCHAAGAPAPMARSHNNTNPDCISCHMPKRRTDDAIHIAMTDHLIQRQPPPNLLAAKQEYYESRATSYKGEVVPYWPAKLAPTEQNQLDLAAAQVEEDSNLRQGITELTALLQKYHPAQADYYVDLADALHDAGEPAPSAATYEEALRHAPNNGGNGSAVILLRLGHAQMDWQQWPQAAATLQRVTVTTPTDPVPWALLGEALFQQGQNAAAQRALTQAITLDPDSAEPYNYLGGLLVRGGDMAGAEKDFRRAIELQPNVAAWQANLAGLLASEGRMPEAGYLFKLSIQLDPQTASTRVEYAQLLTSTGDNAAAEQQAQAAVQDDAEDASAHDIYGYLLTARGDGRDGVKELRTAVRLEPKLWRAYLDLAVALRATGDAAGANAQLRIAAQGDDAAVRAAAVQMLQRH
jgi:predicted CXXCH cytochrome family protein